MTAKDAVSSFAVLLRKYRAAVGFSQEELAEHTGLSRRGISALERGERRSPHPDTVRRLVEALNLSLTDRAQLVASANATIFAADAESPRSSQLPVPLTSFIGREREVAEVRRLLGVARLLTLTGPGGIGKTRLAIEALRAAGDVAFVDFAPLSDGGLVYGATAAALGVRERPHMSWLELLVGTLATREVVLLLDNCEHLIPACSELADQLLRACPRLRIVTTSRQSLAVAGEQLWPVPPLSFDGPPDVRGGHRSDAVRLFAERASLAQPDFVLVGANAVVVDNVCRRLDGIPLAIELAAGRLRALGIVGLVTGLDARFRLLNIETRGVPVRQQTLRATIGWSYDLLSKPEQAFFRRLSVFAGGWTMEAAKAVWGAKNEGHPESALGLLEGLVDKSLVQVEAVAGGAVRYAMLDTVREYALEHLRACDEEAPARRRHSAYFRALAEHAEPELWGSQPELRIGPLEQDLDNLRAAMQWCMESADDCSALKLGVALDRFWLLTGRYREGQVVVTRLLRLTDHEDPTLARARLLHTNAALFAYLGDFVSAQTQAEAALSLMRLLGTDVDVARSLLLLGETVQTRGDYAAARCLLTEAVVLSRRAGAAVELVDAMHYLGGGDAVAAGGYGGSRAHAEECLELALNADYPRGVARARWVLGFISYIEHDLPAARLLLEASTAAACELGDHWATVQASTWLGHLTVDEGDFAAAAALFRHTLELGHQLGDREIFCLFLEGAVHLAAAAGRAERALRLAGAAEAQRKAIDAVLFPAHEMLFQHWLAPARTALGAPRSLLAMADGRALSLEQALVEASVLDVVSNRSPGSGRGRLTDREQQVAVLLARGLSNPQIAGELVISVRTAQRHVENILGKLGFGSRAQVAAWAVGEGLAPSSRSGYGPVGPSSA